MARRFNPPPYWPLPPTKDWLPPPGWQPDPSWPEPPAGWEFFVERAGKRHVAAGAVVAVTLGLVFVGVLSSGGDEPPSALQPIAALPAEEPTAEPATPTSDPAAERAAARREREREQAAEEEAEESEGVSYKNCTAVRAAGAAPIRAGDPGYARHLDSDGDGVGCEN